MTLPILFLICGFFWGLMFEKNRTVKQLMRDPEAFRHAYLKEACKRLSATILLPSRKNSFSGIIRAIWTMCVGIAILLITGCTIPMGSPMGYYTPPRPVNFVAQNEFIPNYPVRTNFPIYTGSPLPYRPDEPFQPRTPIPRPFFGQVGNQTFNGMQ